MNVAAERIPGLVRLVLVVVAVVGTVTSAALYGLPLALLFAAGSVLVWIISMLWTSVQSLAGETALTLEEALSLGAPSAEEERKRAVLRALKDLEYERSVGKITEEDYAELSSRYRAEAKALLQILDRDLAPARELALARLMRRLKKEGLSKADAKSATAAAEASDDTAGDVREVGSKATPAPAPPSVDSEEPGCTSCGTRNDSDARFCKRCGAALERSETPA